MHYYYINFPYCELCVLKIELKYFTQNWCDHHRCEALCRSRSVNVKRNFIHFLNRMFQILTFQFFVIFTPIFFIMKAFRLSTSLKTFWKNFRISKETLIFVLIMLEQLEHLTTFGNEKVLNVQVYRSFS